jgi:hypothetical protein
MVKLQPDKEEEEGADEKKSEEEGIFVLSSAFL